MISSYRLTKAINSYHEKRQMKCTFVPFLLLSAALPGFASDVMAAKADLEGSWTAMSTERDGAPANDLMGHRIEFDGDRFRITKDGTLLFGGRFTANTDKTPAQIDFTIEEGPAKGQHWAGIYKLENDGLTVCDNAPNPAAPRQQDFTAPKGSGYVCLTFRR
jgi:uncharacterized protein (TIGR03067 family)